MHKHDEFHGFKMSIFCGKSSQDDDSSPFFRWKEKLTLFSVLESILYLVKAHVLLVLDLDELGGSGVRDFGPAGPSIFLPLNYFTVWRGS